MHDLFPVFTVVLSAQLVCPFVVPLMWARMDSRPDAGNPNSCET